MTPGTKTSRHWDSLLLIFGNLAHHMEFVNIKKNKKKSINVIEDNLLMVKSSDDAQIATDVFLSRFKLCTSFASARVKLSFIYSDYI